MKRYLTLVLAVSFVLGAITGAASGASTISVGGLENLNLQNFETQGPITFEAREPFGESVNIICNKTVKGHINQVSKGTLVLGGNEAGFINEVNLNGCRGGTSEARLISLREGTNEGIVPLTWLRIERTGVGVLADTAELGADRARFLIRVSTILGQVGCLYIASMRGRGTAVGHVFTRIELELLESRSIRLVIQLEGPSGACPTTARIIGRLTITRPAAGVIVNLHE